MTPTQAVCPIRTTAALALVGLIHAACAAASFAPPLRSTASGMPVSYRPGGGEVRLGGGGLIYHKGLGAGGAGLFNARATIGLHPWVDVEAGLDTLGSTASEDYSSARMGWAGARLHPWPRSRFRPALSAGAGVGCGAAVKREKPASEQPEQPSWNPDQSWTTWGGCGRHEGLVVGGFVGVDLGARISTNFAMYMAHRYQHSVLNGSPVAVPTTHWGQHLLGAEFWIAGELIGVVLGFEGGVGYFANAQDHRTGGTLQVSIGLRWRALDPPSAQHRVGPPHDAMASTGLAPR